jgi:hypothetical protein
LRHCRPLVAGCPATNKADTPMNRTATNFSRVFKATTQYSGNQSGPWTANEP